MSQKRKKGEDSKTPAEKKSKVPKEKQEKKTKIKSKQEKLDVLWEKYSNKNSSRLNHYLLVVSTSDTGLDGKCLIHLQDAIQKNVLNRDQVAAILDSNGSCSSDEVSEECFAFTEAVWDWNRGVDLPVETEIIFWEDSVFPEGKQPVLFFHYQSF